MTAGVCDLKRWHLDGRFEEGAAAPTQALTYRFAGRKRLPSQMKGSSPFLQVGKAPRPDEGSPPLSFPADAAAWTGVQGGGVGAVIHPRRVLFLASHREWCVTCLVPPFPALLITRMMVLTCDQPIHPRRAAGPESGDFYRCRAVCVACKHWRRSVCV